MSIIRPRKEIQKNQKYSEIQILNSTGQIFKIRGDQASPVLDEVADAKHYQMMVFAGAQEQFSSRNEQITTKFLRHPSNNRKIEGCRNLYYKLSL